jgi:hypothetical protein
MTSEYQVEDSDVESPYRHPGNTTHNFTQANAWPIYSTDVSEDYLPQGVFFRLLLLLSSHFEAGRTSVFSDATTLTPFRRPQHSAAHDKQHNKGDGEGGQSFSTAGAQYQQQALHYHTCD